MKVRFVLAGCVAGVYLLLVGWCLLIDPPGTEKAGKSLLAGLPAVLLTLPWSLILKEAVGITLAADPRWLPICIVSGLFNAVIIFGCMLGLGALLAHVFRPRARVGSDAEPGVAADGGA
jgi:hypothetical protein